jgi:Domain of unknown function (DUF4129)
MPELGHSRQSGDQKGFARVRNGAEGGARWSDTAGRITAGYRGRIVLAGLLLVLVFAGLRAGPGLAWQDSWRGPWYRHGTTIAIAVELVFAGLLVALRVRSKRLPHPANPAGWLRYWLTRLIVLAMVALVVPMVQGLPGGNSAYRNHLYTQKIQKPIKIGLRRQPSRTGVGPQYPLVQYLLLVVIALVVIGAFIVLLRRIRHQPPDPDLGPAPDDGSMLREAVDAGRAALGQLSDARMAIINCYLAMERSLGRAGAVRNAAETPDELLARSAGAGLLHGEAPAELTGLFYEARFSSRPVPPAGRDRALAALDAISADLRRAGDRAAAAQAPPVSAP